MNKNLKWLILVVVFPLLTLNLLDAYGCYEIGQLTNGWTEDKISDGVLTYTINGDRKLSSIYSGLVDNAFNAWSKALDYDIKFEKTNSLDADVTVEPTYKGIYKNGIGALAATYPLIDLNDKVVSAKIRVNVYPIENTFNNIIKHEIGHVLGLEHADKELTLMYPIIQGYKVDSCLVDKVMEINFN